MSKLLFLCAFFLSVTALHAQTRIVTGKVTDEKGSPIAGASVIAKGTTVGTTTKENGSFSFTPPASVKTLVISALNFASTEVSIRTGEIGVALKSTSQDLDDVVVTGYTREKKSTFAGAATVISSKSVETVPVGSFDQALQGRAPGMLVNSGSGQPGSSANITIRGVQSIQGATVQPLFVIDGVPAPAFDFQSVNPNDFESITILKDANAAALYGARAGTGVVVITTKRGKTGNTNIQFRTQAGFTQRPNFDRMNLMNTREMLAYEEREKIPSTPGWIYSSLNTANNNTNSSLGVLTPARKQQILDSIGNIDMNYADVFYRKGYTQSHELNISGGTDKTKFYLSAGYFDQQGIDLGSALRRYTTRVNLDHTKDRLNVQLNTLIGYSKTKLSEGEYLGNSARSPFQMTYRAKTYENPYKADGSLNFGSSNSLALKQVANLLEGIQNTQWYNDQLKINGGISVAYKLLPSLTARNKFGIDAAFEENYRHVNPNSYIGSLQTFQSGLAQEANRLTSQLINTTSLIWADRFRDVHDVELGGYFEVVQGYQRGNSFTLYNLDKRLTETGQGAGTLPTGGATTYPQYATAAKTQFGIRSYFGTARYTYDNKYTLNANIRTDGTSRIVNESNREITTWSAGFIWNALQEKFMAKQNIFSELKLRLSYGIVPNIGSIPISTTLNYSLAGLISVTNYQGPQLPSFSSSTYSGSSVTGQIPSSPGNPDLRIEKIKKANIGLDFSVWKNRARFSVDAYQNKTVDLFVNQPLSGISGFSQLTINAGIMTNKGLEFMANVDVLKSKDFLFNVSLNHSINKNKIEDLGLVNEYFLGTFVIRKGLPYGTHYTYNYLGADPATGQPRFETLDGKETLDVAQAGQFAKFGNYLPVHQGGAAFEVRYKGFSLNALFSYQFDVVRSNNTRNWITRGIAGYQQSVRGSRELIDNQWQKAGDVKFFQSSSYDRGFTSSDLEDAKFLRLRNVNLAYSFQSIRAAGKNIVKGGRFYIQGQNLAIWSPWRGLDPEDNNNISLNEYPNPKAVVVGLDINF